MHTDAGTPSSSGGSGASLAVLGRGATNVWRLSMLFAGPAQR